MVTYRSILEIEHQYWGQALIIPETSPRAPSMPS